MPQTRSYTRISSEKFRCNWFMSRLPCLGGCWVGRLDNKFLCSSCRTNVLVRCEVAHRRTDAARCEESVTAAEESIRCENDRQSVHVCSFAFNVQYPANRNAHNMVRVGSLQQSRQSHRSKSRWSRGGNVYCCKLLQEIAARPTNEV